MAFGISGFGASQIAASPQIFQALSVAGKPPQAGASPYGAPRAFNLTAAAQPAFDALARIGQSPSGRPPATFALTAPLPTGVPNLFSIPSTGVRATTATPAGIYALKSIVRTVTNLAVASVYPKAIFSFHA